MRGEWELPGGKLELGETPKATIVREIEEELSLKVTVGPILDSWVYAIDGERIVLIVTYGMHVGSFDGMRCSDEHSEARIFGLDEVTGLNMPSGYKASIERYAALLEIRDSPRPRQTRRSQP
jgi:8-oxo-dGTP pyrophosphatase MutT (NUDIX family)